MNRYLCIHNHFYQPPRENPWLEAIEEQGSAYPYHDWNERISAECYRPNSEARILDSGDWVCDVVNNYAKTNFNFGPTLLSWMEEHDRQTYEKILEGDRLSLKHFGGHGSAIAQAYNHMIMPLANMRDRETQVIWGIKDFERRFERYPESMWLPETAVDVATLEILAAHGMKYVILAPRQAKAVRPLESGGPWTTIQNEAFDLKTPYLVKLSSGRSITAFFYDGKISRAVAFEGLLHNGETFANHLQAAFDPSRKDNQLVHIATDGETYGHHHRHGEMALAYALHHLETRKAAVIVNYGQYLDIQKPKYEAQIHEFSSWSCVHGVERWRENCGCNSGAKGDWHQKWRKPLRESLDGLRDQTAPLFEEKAKEYLHDPWRARDGYIQLILDRSDESLTRFLQEHAKRILTPAEITAVLKMIESQRQLLLMYTSCGWFFDEVSGIETVQNLQYAYRALSLIKQVYELPLEESFREKLADSLSNIPEIGNGVGVLEKYVIPAKVGARKLGAHFAVTSVFEKYSSPLNDIYCSKIALDDFRSRRSGRATLALGRGTVTSKVTRESWTMMFGVIHLGDHNVNAGIGEFISEEKYMAFAEDVEGAFGKADFPHVIRVLDRWFGPVHYSLKDLFKKEQKKFLSSVVADSARHAFERFFDIYEIDYPLISFLSSVHLPRPKFYEHVAEFVQNREIEKALRAEVVDTKKIKKYIQEAKNWNVPIDEIQISRLIEEGLERRMTNLEKSEVTVKKIEGLLVLAKVAIEMPFTFDFADFQAQFFQWHGAQLRDKLNSLSVEEKERVLAPVRQLADILKVRLRT